MFVVGDFVTLNDGVSIEDLVEFGIPFSDAVVVYDHLIRIGGYGIITFSEEGVSGPIYEVQLIDITGDVSNSWYYTEDMLKLHEGNRFSSTRIRGVLRSDELSCEEKLEAIKEIYGE